MTTETVTLYLALLAVFAELLVLGCAAVAIFGSAATRQSMLELVGPHAMIVAFAVATVATLGSLYMSEVAHFVPCRLCWYQRIAMYPLVPVLGLAAWRRDRAVVPYAVLTAGIGAVLSTYHVLLERMPSLESGVCERANPCTVVWVRRFGYLTIPAMALSAFALIITMLVIANVWLRPRTAPPVAAEVVRAR
jgi:disulfide bond formation protein DsbB